MQRQTAILQIPIDKLFSHPENPNRMSKQAYEKLKRHIEGTHNYEPLIVRRHPEIEDGFEIINGHHRAQALRELGEGYADCIEWEVDDDQARILLATLNRLVGKDRLDAKISLIKNLSGKFDSRELAKILPDTKAVIEKLKSIESQIQNDEFQISNLKFEMRHSLAFFLDDEQMKIVEAAIRRCESEKSVKSEKGTEKQSKAEERAGAITRIAGEWMEKVKNKK